MKRIRNYSVSWILFVILFNIICFVTPNKINGHNKFTGAFWSGYIFIMLAFVINLVFSIYTFTSKNEREQEIHFPIMYVGIFELAIMVIAGGIIMLTPNVSNWIAIVVCYSVLVISGVLSLAMDTVGRNATDTNMSFNEKTAVWRLVKQDSNLLLRYVSSEDEKRLVNEIIEAIKYSDPVSSEMTIEIEEDIAYRLKKIQKQSAISNAEANEILTLIEKRKLLSQESKHKK